MTDALFAAVQQLDEGRCLTQPEQGRIGQRDKQQEAEDARERQIDMLGYPGRQAVCRQGGEDMLFRLGQQQVQRGKARAGEQHARLRERIDQIHGRFMRERVRADCARR